VEHRDAWVRNRDRLLPGYRHGRRPAAWWRFESPIKYPGYDREQSTLYAAGLLTEEESAELVGWWSEQYTRAQDPNFFYCRGPGDILKGAIARREHYKWADIPRALLRQWTLEYRRRDRVVRKLKAAPEQPVPAA
jgi:hypothetical protein